MHFKTEDDLSGLEYYEVKIDEERAEIKEGPYRLSPQPSGKHFVEVRAFDKTENFSSATAEFEILPTVGIIPEEVGLPPLLKFGTIANRERIRIKLLI